jgi:hypothetical protein
MTETRDELEHSETTDRDPVESQPTPGPQLDDWKLWPPSPKMQIVLIAIGFGLFNFMLLAIWAWVMIREFG